VCWHLARAADDVGAPSLGGGVECVGRLGAPLRADNDIKREIAGDSRATGKFQDGGEDAHAHDGVTETYGSAGASSQARTRSASTGRDQVAEARSSINRAVTAPSPDRSGSAM